MRRSVSRAAVVMMSCTLLVLSSTGCEKATKEASAEKAPPAMPEEIVGEKPRDSDRIPEGQRLVMLSLTQEQAGRLERNDRVDVISTFQRRENRTTPNLDADPETKERMLHLGVNTLQNITTLGAHCAAGTCAVKLLLTSEEATLLELMSSNAGVSLARRNRDDIEVYTVRRESLRDALANLEVLQMQRQKRLEKAGIKPRQEKSVSVNDPRKRSCPPASKQKEPTGLQPGMRAATFEFEGHDPRALEIKPNDWIDLSGTFRVDERDLLSASTRERSELGNLVNLTLLQQVRVLESDGNHLTLVLTPEEVLMLRLAQSRGELHYRLRNREDRKTHSIVKRTMKEVLEDLEVIQMERRQRSKKRRRHKKHGPVITMRSSGGGSGGSSGSFAASHNAPRPHHKDSSESSSTFGLDVDAGSYTRMREQVNRGGLPVASEVRVEEYLNYFDWGLPQPEDGQAMGISFEATPDPMVAMETRAGHHIVRVGVKAKDLSKDERKPAHLTFLVDTSGSMRSEGRLDKVKNALKVLVNNLDKEDTVSLVTYAGGARIVLGATGADKRDQLLDAIDDLTPGGGTAMEAGLKFAYRAAIEGFVEGDINRVIVLSDGIANVGATTHHQMLDTIRGQIDRGVTLSTIGVGTGDYRDELMEQLADKGDGNYYFIDSYDEIERVFLEQIDGTLQVVARDAKFQVNFDKSKVKTFRLLGYENRALAKEDFEDDAVDAGEVGAGHEVTALYAITLEPGQTLADALSVSLRYQGEDGKIHEQTRALRQRDIRSLSASSPAHRFALGVAALAEILRDSETGKTLRFEPFQKLMTAGSSQFIEEDPRKQEFLELYVKVRDMLGCHKL